MSYFVSQPSNPRIAWKLSDVYTEADAHIKQQANQLLAMNEALTSATKRIEILERENAELRNATLEEAAALCAEMATPSPGDTQSDGQFAALYLATRIRSMKA